MLSRILMCCLMVGSATIAGQATAQTRSQTPAPPAMVNTSYGDRQDDDEETDQEALAKQMDEFHKRLKSLEQGATELADAQKDATFVDRLDETDESLKAYGKAIGDIDDALGDFPKTGHGDMTMKIYGRLHLDYWHFGSEGDDIDTLEGGDPQDRFNFRRMRIGVGGNIDDNMIYKLELEFAGGNNPSYRDAYIGIEHLPLFNTVLIGNHKRPYGLDHLNSSKNNVFIERPLSIEAFNQDNRRLGISSNGYSDDLCSNWRYGVYNQELTQNKAGYIGDHYQLELASRLARTFWWDQASDGRGYGHVAFSSSYGEPNGLGPNNQSRYRTRPEARSTQRWIDTGTIAGAHEFYLAGLEGVLNVGPLQLVGEYQHVEVDRLDAFGSDVRFHGGYLYASYFLTGEHIPWNRKTGTLGRVKPYENFFSVCDCDGFVQRGMGAWQVAARYSYTDFTDEDIDGGRGRALTLGLNWYWNAYARMQFNYILGDIESNATVAGDYQIFGARFMVDF